MCIFCFMKKLSKLFILTIFLSIFVSSHVFAATPANDASVATTPKTEKVILANVNVSNTKIISQKGNNFDISFSLSNGLGVQTGIYYSVLLSEDTHSGQITVDEKVYTESLSLAENSNINREINYTAPGVLDGTYQLLLISKNSSGLSFGGALLGKVKISNTTKGIQIVPGSCVFSVKGEKTKASTYVQGRIISLLPSDDFKVSCDVVNQLDKEIKVSPSFIATEGSSYGKEVAISSVSANSDIALKSLEKKKITLDIPKNITPKTYHSLLSLKSGETNSNAIGFTYVIKGNTASIDFISMDKDYYKKGDTLNLSFLWYYTSSDNSHKGSLLLNTKVINGNGKECASMVNQTLATDFSKPITEFPISITKTCFNPQVLITLKDDSGNIFDQKSLKMNTMSVKQNQNSKLNIVYIFISIVIIASIIYVKRKKFLKTDPANNIESNSGDTNINIILPFFLLITSLLFIPTHSIHAETYTINDMSSGCHISGSVSISGGTGGGSTFRANTNISAYADYSVDTCMGVGGVSAYNNKDSSTQTILNFNSSLGSGWGSKSFNVGSSSTYGYSIQFSAGNSVGTMLYGFSGNFPYTVYDPATVTAYANGVAGSISIPYNGSPMIKWMSSSATSCTCTYNGSSSCGSSGVSNGSYQGNVTINNLTRTTTFSVTCLPI